jgi:hypothetical protein
MAARVALPSTGSQVIRSSLHKTGSVLYGPTTTFSCTSQHFSSPRLEAVQHSHCSTFLRRLKNAGRGRIQRFGSSSMKQTKKERCRVARAQVSNQSWRFMGSTSTCCISCIWHSANRKEVLPTAMAWPLTSAYRARFEFSYYLTPSSKCCN